MIRNGRNFAKAAGRSDIVAGLDFGQAAEPDADVGATTLGIEPVTNAVQPAVDISFERRAESELGKPAELPGFLVDQRCDDLRPAAPRGRTEQRAAVGSKPRTSPPIFTGQALASKRVIGTMPERPATRLTRFPEP